MKSLAPVAGRVAVLMAVYAALQWWLFRVTRLEAASYAEASIALQVVLGLFRPIALLPLVALVAVCWRRPVSARWSELDDGRTVHVLALVPTAILAWIFSTYDYNAWFDREHAIDRALLIALAALVAWRPVFVLPFVVLVAAIIRQFYEPIGGYSIAQHFMLVRVLLLFYAVFLIAMVTGRRGFVDWVFCSVALVASSYWTCGIGKVVIGWLDFGHVYHLLPATYANGWLGFLEPETVSEITRALASFDWPMRAFTILVECGALLFFWRRAIALGLLAGWIVFHVGVFATSGICFWEWVVVDATFLWLFADRERAKRFPVFAPSYLVTSLVLILGSRLWFDPVDLAWFDARASYTYRLEAVTDDGRTHRLPPRWFAPYDYQFTLSGFGYLVDGPRLPIVWGAVFDREIADRLVAARTASDVLAVEAALGERAFDPERRARFEQLVARVAANYAARGTRSTWLSWARAPAQLWTFPEPPFAWTGGPIRRVIVREVLSAWLDDRYVELREVEVASIEVPLAK